MAKKSKNRKSKRRIPRRIPSPKINFGNTRLQAKLPSLRFTPQTAINFVSPKKRQKQPERRRVRPQRTETPRNGIKRLTPTINVVQTDNRICKRRHERKEIIHALGKSGQGGQKKPDNKTRSTKCL
jgi:hypothetical protein